MTKSFDQSISVKRGDETRRRLVAAAIEVVASDGWEGATTRRIAHRAGANQALIGYHFGSKEGLLQAALDAALREGFAAPVDAMLAGPSLFDGVAALVRELHQMDEAQPVVRFSMEAMARASRDDAVRAVMAGVLDELRGTLAEGVRAAQERGEVPPEADPRGIAVLLAAAFDGLGLHALVDPSLDIEPAVAAMRTLLTTTQEES